jgi:prevent-host-death family protein
VFTKQVRHGVLDSPVSRVIHWDMSKITIRELRNHGGRVLERVARGETLTVTRAGRPLAELRPLPPGALPADELLRRWRGLPPVDPNRLRADLDGVSDPTL